MLPYLRCLALALAGAGLALLVHLPLPWLVGPLLAVSGAGVGGVVPPALPFVRRSRDVGQWIIGTALGLYFTPEVVREVARLAPWIALTSVFAMALGVAGGRLLQRLSGQDAVTCFFASAIGGASEMAAQAERNGGQIDRVAAAHGLRIVMVALIVPLTLALAGVHGADPYDPAARQTSIVGLIALAAVTGGGAAVLQRFAVPNQWMLGPLLVTAFVTASGNVLSALPVPVLDAGQLLIGVALGSRFGPDFFHAAPRFLGAVAVMTVGYLLASCVFGLLMAQVVAVPAPTLVLASTPGGIGEMAITAKLLRLGAPVVTAFHAIRMTLVVLTIGPLFRLVRPAPRSGP